MKQFFIEICSALCIILLMFTSSQAQNLSILSHNGNTSNIDISTVKSIVFENNNIVVNTTDCGSNFFNVSYSEKITFGETTGIDNDESQVNGINIYPNPATNTLVINTQSDYQTNARIISASGAVLMSFTITDKQSVIDISNLPGGLYFIVTDNESTKFIKQ